MNVKSIYKKYDDRTVQYMEALVKKLQNQYGSINDEWRVSLDLIAFNMNLIYLCQDDIIANGLQKVDDRGRIAKNPSISTMATTQNYLLKLLNSFGLNLASASKIKPMETDDGFDALIEK